MSYSGYKSGPPRGRGFMSRGSHRGSSSGGAWRGNNRGGYSPPRSSSRGRGGWHREPPSSSSYEHGRSSRYSDMNEERFSTRSRDDGSFRRYSRQESPGYMEGGHHRSPDIPRKRMRSSDHGFSQSHHRSHESSSYDMNGRYSSSSGGGGGGGYEEKGYDRYRDERRSYRDHHSSSGDRYPPSRDDYMHHRKDKDMDRHESMGRSSMPPPPPPSMNPRHSASPRRSSFRGRGGIDRGIRSRGRSSILRGSSRGSRTPLALRKVDGPASLKRKSMVEASYVIKKKILASSRSQEQQKKLRMQKMRRIKESLENADENEEPIEKEKEGWKDDKETKQQEECGAEPVSVKPVKSEGEEETEKPSKEGESKSEPTEEKKEAVDSNSVQVTIKQNSEGRAVNEEGSHKSSSARRFIRLQCPHCHERCVTFKQYTTHLYSPRHLTAMSRLHTRHKQTVVRMRQQQRKQQREEEENDAESLAKFSSFCPVCKLNYRQTRIVHSNSKMHQEMKTYLFPYCKVCGIPFKATLLYDKHICSLEHIRREAYMEERLKQLEGRVRSKRDEDDQEADMDGFMIVDSVGDVDDAEEGDADKVEEKIDMETLVGVECVKKVETQYCELCQRYLPRLDDQERALAVHCRSSLHLRLYREQQRKVKPEVVEDKPAPEPEQNGKEKEGHVDEEDAGEGSPSEVGLEVGEAADPEEEEDEEEEKEHAHEEEALEEKLWASVDKDLGELLRDVEPEEEERGKSSDDDEESVAESGRYDRFRNSEKNKQKQAGKAASNGNEPASVTKEKE